MAMPMAMSPTARGSSLINARMRLRFGSASARRAVSTSGTKAIQTYVCTNVNRWSCAVASPGPVPLREVRSPPRGSFPYPYDLLMLGLASFRIGRMLAYEGVAEPLRALVTIMSAVGIAQLCHSATEWLDWN